VSAGTRTSPRDGGELEVTVTALGAAGDGIAETPAGRIYLPLALPGERWRVRLAQKLPQGWRAEPLACLAPVLRAEPVCPHFGRCGGCRLQHLPPELYALHKRARIVEALARRGLPTAVVGEVRITPPASRRRVRLGLARAGRRLQLGFRARGSHRLELVTACPIACPELVEALPGLAEGLAAALAAPLPEEASLTLTATGIDLLLHARRPPSPDERQRLAALAAALDLARIGWAEGERATPEPIAVCRPPVVRLAGIPVEPPPGAFLQATAFGEATLGAAVAAWGEGAARAVDLFAGIGTLTFALAGTARRVHAYEGDAASAAALRRAAGAARLGHVAVEVRDLARRPLAPAELKGCDLVVLDPPRAGAAEQAGALAAASVPRVIHASCHPESFARDARTLVDGGFELVEVQPVDQFLYAAEVELVALFVRPGARPPKKS
jgi:23S rRNA (uracil1939-C5)-methyltransferase